MKRPIAMFALIALAGCATAMPGPGGARCNAAPLAAMSGKRVTPALKHRALRRSGAKTLRVIAPGMMVTMDYRQDRLNIHTDAHNRVTRIDCG